MNKSLQALPFYLGALVLMTACSQEQGQTSHSTDPALKQVMFDDFAYPDLTAFYANGWKSRDETGHPGIKGATWSDEGISFHQAPTGAEHGILRMASQTAGQGENTRHTQICHARKYLQGTYAARVFFRDEPTFGPDGDEVIQTFYAISPIEAPMDPDYSETDFEYLPNGGWGHNHDPAMWTTTWETFQLEPWTPVNENTRQGGSYAGWHTLLLQVEEDAVRYYVDGQLFSTHSAAVAPEVHMSMNFNLWFMPKGADGSQGPLESTELREYQQDIDWVYHSAGELLSQDDVEQRVAALRANQQFFIDTVAEQSPALPSPCGL